MNGRRPSAPGNLLRIAVLTGDTVDHGVARGLAFLDFPFDACQRDDQHDRHHGEREEFKSKISVHIRSLSIRATSIRTDDGGDVKRVCVLDGVCACRGQRQYGYRAAIGMVNQSDSAAMQARGLLNEI